MTRSYLYVPGDKPDLLAKAASKGADAIIADLEDAVAPDRKDEARAAVAEWLAARPAGEAGPQIWVRVNGGELLEDDVSAIGPLAPHGLYLPKVSSPADVERADAALGDADMPVVALIETAAGVLDARAIGGSPRVARLALGEADLGAELGVEPSSDGREWIAARSMVVLASAAAGLDPPVAPVATDFRDLDAYRASTLALKRMGFGARAAIHPAQVPVINDVFTPSEEEIVAARRILERFEAAGRGVTTDDDGRMIDDALVRSARRTLRRAGLDL